LTLLFLSGHALEDLVERLIPIEAELDPRGFFVLQHQRVGDWESVQQWGLAG
jgi:hypothetical protein